MVSPVILRDGIAHSGGKYVANEFLTPSERRERVIFGLERSHTEPSIQNRPPARQILQKTKNLHFQDFLYTNVST